MHTLEVGTVIPPAQPLSAGEAGWKRPEGRRMCTPSSWTDRQGSRDRVSGVGVVGRPWPPETRVVLVQTNLSSQGPGSAAFSRSTCSSPTSLEQEEGREAVRHPPLQSQRVQSHLLQPPPCPCAEIRTCSPLPLPALEAPVQMHRETACAKLNYERDLFSHVCTHPRN